LVRWVASDGPSHGPDGPRLPHGHPRRRDARSSGSLIRPVAVDPHASGAGFWPQQDAPDLRRRPVAPRTVPSGGRGRVPAR
jgi:hypothetical protein